MIYVLIVTFLGLLWAGRRVAISRRYASLRWQASTMQPALYKCGRVDELCNWTHGQQTHRMKMHILKEKQRLYTRAGDCNKSNIISKGLYEASREKAKYQIKYVYE
jgi:hypothetical protein